MNREQFLQSLDKRLEKLPKEEREDIRHDFEEHFTFGRAEGKTEEEIVDSLGNPEKLAKELLATYHLEKVEATASTGNVFRAMWAVIGLGFFNLVIVLGPFITLVAVILSGWVLAGGFALSPLLVLVNTIIYPESFAIFDLFFSLLLCGLGLFIGIGMYFATRVMVTGFVRYLQFNMRLVKGGMKDD